MSKKILTIRSRVFLANKRDLMELAFGLVRGTSTNYSNFKMLPFLAESLSDADLEQLTREVMRILDIGAIESAQIRKDTYKSEGIEQSLRKQRIAEFKNLDVSHYLTKTNNE